MIKMIYKFNQMKIFLLTISITIETYSILSIRALNSITNSTKSGTESSMGERSEEDQKKMNKDNLL